MDCKFWKAWLYSLPLKRQTFIRDFVIWLLFTNRLQVQTTFCFLRKTSTQWTLSLLKHHLLICYVICLFAISHAYLKSMIWYTEVKLTNVCMCVWLFQKWYIVKKMYLYICLYIVYHAGTLYINLCIFLRNSLF